MYSTVELTNFGKSIARDYINNNVSMTDSLLKLASARNLTSEQTKRVAEFANVDACLHFLKTAENKYVQFPLADSKMVKIATKHIDTEHYADPSLLDINPFDLYPKTGFDRMRQEIEEGKAPQDFSREKLAEYNRSISQIPTFSKEAEEKIAREDIRVKATILRDEAMNWFANTTKCYDQLKGHVKQAVLSGNSYSDVYNILKEAAEYIAEDLEVQLKHDLPNIQLERTSSEAVPNPDSVLYKTAQDLQTSIIQTSKFASAFETVNKDKIVKEAGVFSLLGKGLWQAVKHPMIPIALAGTYITYGKGKRVGALEQGQVLQEKLFRLGEIKNNVKI